MLPPARPSPNLTDKQRSSHLPDRAGRALLVLVMLLGFGGQILLTAASLPEESPRATILRLTGLDIAPASMKAMPAMGAEMGASGHQPPGGTAAEDTHDEAQQPGTHARPAPATHDIMSGIMRDAAARFRQEVKPQAASSTHAPMVSAMVHMARHTPTASDEAAHPSRNNALATSGTEPATAVPRAMTGPAGMDRQPARNPEQAREGMAMKDGMADMAHASARTGPGHEGMRAQTCLHHGAPARGQDGATRTAHPAHGVASHGAHHHHGLDCPLCPLLGHVIFMLACLHVLLEGTRLSRKLWQAATPAPAPPEPAHQRPPSRGPPAAFLIHATA